MGEIILYQEKSLTHSVTNNLVVQDIKDSNLTKDCKMVIIASKCFPKINSLKGEVYPKDTLMGNLNLSGMEIRQFEIRQHINKSILHSGYGASLEDIDMKELILSVIEDVLTDFSHLTTQEVGIAFRKGCREEYGEYRGVNTRVFYKWIKSYCSETRFDSLKSFSKLDVPKVVKPTQEYLDKKHKDWLNYIYESYDEFVKTGDLKYYDINNMFYEYLKKLGILRVNKKNRDRILKEAEKIIRIQNDPRKEPNQFKRIPLIKFIEKLNNKDKSLDSKILSQAKHIHLKMFLTDLRRNKKSLKTIITNKTQQS